MTCDAKKRLRDVRRYLSLKEEYFLLPRNIEEDSNDPYKNVIRVRHLKMF